MSVVDRLDIRRAQVLVEAILVEISDDKAAELGVNWAVGSTDADSTVPIGTFNQPVGGASIGSIAAAIRDPDTLATAGAADRPDARRRPLPRQRHQLRACCCARCAATATPTSCRRRRSSRSTTRKRRSRSRRKCRSSPASTPTPARHQQRHGQPVPDHSARGSRQHPQDHAADQRRRLRCMLKIEQEASSVAAGRSRARST